MASVQERPGRSGVLFAVCAFQFGVGAWLVTLLELETWVMWVFAGVAVVCGGRAVLLLILGARSAVRELAEWRHAEREARREAS